MINTHTTSVTYAGLLAASELATVTGDEESAVKWRNAAEDISSRAIIYDCAQPLRP